MTGASQQRAEYYAMYGRQHGTGLDRALKARHFARAFRFLHDAPGGGPTLDAGCGLGVYADLLRASGARVIGLEANAAGATATQTQGIPVVRGTLDALPFGGGSLSGVFMCDVLATLTPTQAEATLREFHRCLSPGGRIVLISPNWAHPAIRKSYHDPLHQHAYSMAELSSLLRRTGFEPRVGTKLSLGSLPGAGLVGRLRPARPLAYALLKGSAFVRGRRLHIVAYGTRGTTCS